MTAQFLRSVATALPGAVIEVDGTLTARELVLDKPVTLVGGTLRAAIVVKSQGVVLSRMRLESGGNGPALRVVTGEALLDRCTVEGGGLRLEGGVLNAVGTTLRNIVGDGVDANSGTLRMETCKVQCGGVGLRASRDSAVTLDGIEIEGANTGLLVDGCAQLTARATRLSDNGVNLDVVDAELALDGLDVGPSGECGVRVRSGALTLRHASVRGHTAVAALVLGGRLALDGCTVGGGATTLEVAAGSLVVTGTSVGPASPGGVELRFAAGAAVKLAASRIHTSGFAWSEATIVCLDTSFGGAATALAVRAPGSLHADGSTFSAVGTVALRLDGADAELERCHLHGREGMTIWDATATLGRCEVHTSDEGIGLRLSGARLHASKCLLRGGVVVLDARDSEIVLAEVKVSGGDATRDGICADEQSTVRLERCQVDGVQQSAILAHALDADSTHIVGGIHWGVRVSGFGASTSLRKCLVQAPVGFAAVSVDSHVELVGCNLEGQRALVLGPRCRGSATRCTLRGTQVGVFVFDYGVQGLLDECKVRAPIAIDYKRGYSLTIRGGEIDGVVRVEDRKLVLEGVDIAQLDVQPRGRVDRGSEPPQMPTWTQASAATRKIDVCGDWHDYHRLLEEALADPDVALVNIPEYVESAPRLALERRVGPAPWPPRWRISADRARIVDDYLQLIAVWIRGATGDEVTWEEVELETWPSHFAPNTSVRGVWRCAGWRLSGESIEGKEGNPRDGYAFDVRWQLRRDDAPVFCVEGQFQSPFPTDCLQIEAPSIPPEACWRAAALVHAWNKSL